MTKQIKDLTLEEIFKNCEAWGYDCEYCDLHIGNLCPQSIFSGLREDADLASYMEMYVTKDDEGLYALAPSKLNDLERLLLKVFSNADYVLKDGEHISFWKGGVPEEGPDEWYGSECIGEIKRSDIFEFIPDKQCRKVCYLREAGTP